jgi:hypothetical protein
MIAPHTTPCQECYTSLGAKNNKKHSFKSFNSRSVISSMSTILHARVQQVY